MFPIIEFISNYSEEFIILYSILILWINIDYLRDHKNITKELEELPPTSEEELWIDPNSIFITIIRLIFNFIRRWFIYLLAISITESIFVIIISIILFVVSLYDTLFNYSLAKITKSKISLYLIISDTIFILIFIMYIVFY